MWRCPDLEKEEERQDYYSRKQNENDEPTVKEGLEQVASGARKGYVLNSVAAGVTRKYITGFDLSVESDVLPFNTMKMFEDRRIVPGSFELEETVFYYYPMQYNRVSDRLAKLEENKSDMQLSKDRLKLDHATAADGVHLKCAGMIKMAARFGVKLTQRMDMKKYPFDRQILAVTLYIRPSWEVQTAAPDWMDTGHASDKTACQVYLSEAIVHYTLHKPWIEGRKEGPKANDWMHVRVQERSA